MIPLLARRMATALHDRGSDLGDERIVIQDLISAGYTPGDIVQHMDDAIEIARRISFQARLREGFAVVAITLLFIMAWVALPGDAFAADNLARDAHVHAREGRG